MNKTALCCLWHSILVVHCTLCLDYGHTTRVHGLPVWFTPTHVCLHWVPCVFSTRLRINLNGFPVLLFSTFLQTDARIFKPPLNIELFIINFQIWFAIHSTNKNSIRIQNITSQWYNQHVKNVWERLSDTNNDQGGAARTCRVKFASLVFIWEHSFFQGHVC